MMSATVAALALWRFGEKDEGDANLGEETLYSRRGCRAPEVLAGHHTQVGKLLCILLNNAPASLPPVVPGAYCCSSVVQRF